MEEALRWDYCDIQVDSYIRSRITHIKTYELVRDVCRQQKSNVSDGNRDKIRLICIVFFRVTCALARGRLEKREQTIVSDRKDFPPSQQKKTKPQRNSARFVFVSLFLEYIHKNATWLEYSHFS